jgi:antitoxin VapB
MKTAKVFRTGRSQAVRLPKEFRFRDLVVAIHKEGESVILEPIRKSSWPRGFWSRIRIEDRGFTRPEQGKIQERRSLDGKD